MASDKIITGLDIGSSVIRMVVGQVAKTGENGEQNLNIIGAVEVPAQGVNKGTVAGIEDAVSSISACLEKAERMIGMPIETVWVGIGGTHIQSQETNGVIAIARTNGEIQESDVERVVEAARAVAAPVNYEVLHVIPKTFSVDSQSGVNDPVGMSGIRLEVTTQVVRGLSAQVKNLTKSIYRTGLDINDLVLSVLAAGESCLSLRQRELGVALVDMGASTTKLIVFEEGNMVHLSVLPVGADHITADLAIGLQTSLDVAEKVKLEVGDAVPENFERSDEINLKDFGGDDQTFSKKYVADIIEARVEEIFEKVDEQLQSINRSGLLPAGLVLIGGGAKLSGVPEVAKKKTMLPASLGVGKKYNSAAEKAGELEYTVAVGLVQWGYNAMSEKGFGNFTGRVGSTVKETADKVKDWLKNLVS